MCNFDAQQLELLCSKASTSVGLLRRGTKSVRVLQWMCNFDAWHIELLSSKAVPVLDCEASDSFITAIAMRVPCLNVKHSYLDEGIRWEHSLYCVYCDE